MHDKTQTNYTNQLAGAVKARKQNVELNRAAASTRYDASPKLCKHCDGPIPYNKRSNQFCSQSCAGTFNTGSRDYTTFKPGPPIGTGAKPPYTKIKMCTVCNKYHPGSGRTCSKECKSVILSISAKTRISKGFNPQLNRGRNKRSYLEISFSGWLNTMYPTLEVKIEHPFKRNDITKTYFADFYFPSKRLIIELDGSQHKHTVDYDAERDRYITDAYGVTVIRITHKEYQSGAKVQEIINLLA